MAQVSPAIVRRDIPAIVRRDREINSNLEMKDFLKRVVSIRPSTATRSYSTTDICMFSCILVRNDLLLLA